MKMPAVQLSAPAQGQVDPALTLALAQASIAAYDYYKGNRVIPPENFRMVAQWTGWAECLWGWGEEERFGVVFQSTPPGSQSTFIFAFRGTDSASDICADLWAQTTLFVPYDSRVTPAASVASGFYSVYNDKGTLTQSMRQQIFSLLARFKPEKLYITGHSLGGALSQLFTLDVALSRPEIWVANLNFASPMVGLGDWQTAYESQPAQKDPARKTVRIYNYWDQVPSLPGSAFSYKNVGRGFRTSFYVNSLISPWYQVARHSLLNLQVVLKHAVWVDPQVWVGTFADRTDASLEMLSTVPPSGPDVDWSVKMRELDQFEQTILEGGPVPDYVRG
jgi:triacylglycerol lipase